MSENEAKTEQLKLIRLPEVMTKTGLARPTIYRAVAAEKFPKPVKFGAATAWVLGEVDSWIQARMAERRDGIAA